jgi:hypothetical protein
LDDDETGGDKRTDREHLDYPILHEISSFGARPKSAPSCHVDDELGAYRSMSVVALSLSFDRFTH